MPEFKACMNLKDCSDQIIHHLGFIICKFIPAEIVLKFEDRRFFVYFIAVTMLFHVTAFRLGVFKLFSKKKQHFAIKLC